MKYIIAFVYWLWCIPWVAVFYVSLMCMVLSILFTLGCEEADALTDRIMNR